MTLKLFVALVLVLSFAAAARSDAADDKDAVQGTWLPAEAELAGQKFPDEVRKSIKLVLQGDQYTVTVGTQPDKGTCKWNASAKPKAVDITGTDGPKKGKTALAI